MDPRLTDKERGLLCLLERKGINLKIGVNSNFRTIRHGYEILEIKGQRLYYDLTKKLNIKDLTQKETLRFNYSGFVISLSPAATEDFLSNHGEEYTLR